MTEKRENFETELPEGYREVMAVDCKSDKKLLLRMNLFSFAISVGGIALTVLVMRNRLHAAEYARSGSLLACVGMLLYIVVHELLHGLAYKLTTGHKLTFGLTLSVAYCGVPDIYVYRRASLIALLTPFLVMTAVYLLAAALVTAAWARFYLLCLFFLHFGGCTGDLYNTGLYLFRFQNPLTLVRDTGPVQTFYLPEEEK